MESVEVVVVGAGPAGLTAAYELARRGRSCTVFEADSVVGGISRTVERDGWRFDIGGHRFFTKVARVEDFWHEILGADDFLLRPRMSRIYYNKRFFDYPLKASNALWNLGLFEALRCLVSYAWVRVRPPKDQSSFEGWVAARFGWRLYRIFFKTYTEKLWGIPASSIQADWAAQRIKNLSLGRAIVNAVKPKRNQTEITSLIEEFRYPKYGPGMMWEACAHKVVTAGSQVRLSTVVRGIARGEDGALVVTVEDRDGAEHQVRCRDLISTMPMTALVESLAPADATAVPLEVRAAAEGLAYRDFLTIALVVPEKFSFPDNWIYIHSPDVRLGRVQNFGAWSPHMVKEGRTCLGLEYFVNQGDDLWDSADDELVALGTRELHTLELAETSAVEVGYVVRMAKAYPVYDEDYAANVGTIRKYLEAEWPDVHPVGRNGMHRYNNQDHSMLTAMLTVENILDDTGHDIWAVNVEEDYHEKGGTSGGTGRDAPIIPRPAPERVRRDGD